MSRWGLAWRLCLLVACGFPAVAAPPPSSPEAPAVAESRLKRYVVGIQCEPLDDEMKKACGLESGLRITEVLPELPGAAAGLRRGDIIVSADGEPLRQALDLTAAIARAAPRAIRLRVRPSANPAQPGRDVRVVPTDADRVRERAAARAAMLALLRRRLRGTEQEALLPQIEEWLKRSDGRPLKAIEIRPGVLLPAVRSLPALPAETSVSLTQRADEALQIVVRHGDRSWQGSAESWPEWVSRLPEEVRPAVRAYLIALLSPPPAPAVSPSPRELERLAARLARVERELQGLAEALGRVLDKRKKNR